MPKKKSVKSMTAVQLPSGSWRVQFRLPGGERQSITRPTEKEALRAAMLAKAEEPPAPSVLSRSSTVAEAVEAYISKRQHSKSPNTVQGYRVIQRNRFPEIQCLQLRDLTPARWQEAIDLEASRVSSHTVRNSVGLIQAAYREATGIRLSSSPVQVVSEEREWLDPDQIPVFLDAIKGNPYEIPALLALSGLRRSELGALKWKSIDLKKNTITVHGSIALVNGKIVDREENKNTSSRRTVRFIIPRLRQAIQEKPRDPDAYIFRNLSGTLQRNIDRVCAAAGLPLVGVHGLRHTFASLCAHLQIPEQITMEMGGWSDPTIVRKIYTHIGSKDVLDQSKRFESFFLPDLLSSVRPPNALEEALISSVGLDPASVSIVTATGPGLHLLHTATNAVITITHAQLSHDLSHAD